MGEKGSQGEAWRVSYMATSSEVSTSAQWPWGRKRAGGGGKEGRTPSTSPGHGPPPPCPSPTLRPHCPYVSMASVTNSQKLKWLHSLVVCRSAA